MINGLHISDLRKVAQFSKTIAERGWHEWWSDTDVPLSDYHAAIEQMVEDDGIPSALVAHIGDRYVGSVLLIENDLELRPDYTPWIAALWVEPEFRKNGVASALIRAAKGQAFSLGQTTCYLCASQGNSPYYLARGFKQIEADIQGQNIFEINSATS